MSDKPENAVQETEPSEEITETTPMQGPQLLVGLAVGLSILSGSSGLAWYFWANQEEAQRRPQRAKIADVQAVRLQPTNYTIHLPSQGRVQARAATGISPEVGGRIQSIEPAFKEGGFFTPGQKLLTLDKSDYLNAVAKAEGALSQLEAKLALERINRAGFTNAVSVAVANLEQAQVALALDKIEATSFSNALNVAKANLEQARVALRLQMLERNSYSNAVSVAQANLKQSEATLELKRAERSAAIANLKRLGKLEGASPLARKEPQVAEAQADVDAKRAALEKAAKDLREKPMQMEADLMAKIDVAQVQLTEARENLKLPAQREANLQAKIKVAQVQLTEAKEGLERPAQLEADLRAQIKVAESELAKARRDANRTVVRAPMYPGRITEKRVDIGQVVTAGSVLATAIATDFAEVRLPVSNRQLAHLNIPEPLVGTNDTQALANQPAQNRPPVELRAEIGSVVHRWPGHIDRAEGQFDATSQQLFLIAQVPEPYRKRPALRAGLFVRADIIGNTLNDVYKLPRHVVRRGNEVALAIQWHTPWLYPKSATIKPKKGLPNGAKPKGGKKWVNPYILIRKNISILWQDEKWIITKKLQPNDVLVTTPIDYATNGQELRVNLQGESSSDTNPANGQLEDE